MPRDYALCGRFWTERHVAGSGNSSRVNGTQPKWLAELRVLRVVSSKISSNSQGERPLTSNGSGKDMLSSKTKLVGLYLKLEGGEFLGSQYGPRELQPIANPELAHELLLITRITNE